MPTSICTANMIKVADIIPQGSCNLAYYAVRKPSVTESVNIANLLEQNINEYILLTPDITNVDSRVFLITDRYYSLPAGKIEPLYYSYRLEYPVYNINDKAGLSITSTSGPVPDKYKIIQEIDEIDENTVSVTLYTNFSAQDNAGLSIIYNTLINGKVTIARKELIKPLPYMNRRYDNAMLNVNEYRVVEETGALYQYKVERPTTNTYYLLPLDGMFIGCKTPVDINGKWYLRISNGSSEKYIADIADPKRALYSVPDYYGQTFSAISFPYMKSTNELASVISNNIVNVINHPMYVHTDLSNVVVKVNSETVYPVTVDINTGNIKLPIIINPNDTVLVSYYYIEDSFIYKGYNYTKKNGTPVFVNLDINPSLNSIHEYDYIDENDNLITSKSFTLLNKTIYIYSYPSRIRSISNSNNGEFSVLSINREVIDIPTSRLSTRYLDIELDLSIIKDSFNTEIRTKYSDEVVPYKGDGVNTNGKCTWEYVEDNTRMIRLWDINILCGEPIVVRYLASNKVSNEISDVKRDTNTLFHTIRKLTQQELDKDNIILVAEVYVRPNCYRDATTLIDTRVRGGGLIDMSETLSVEINPESQYYLDIGDIYGQPIQENGVIIVDVDENLLLEKGGKFTKQEIEAAINKHKGAGILPVIRYIEPTVHNKIV